MLQGWGGVWGPGSGGAVCLSKTVYIKTLQIWQTGLCVIWHILMYTLIRYSFMDINDVLIWGQILSVGLPCFMSSKSKRTIIIQHYFNFFKMKNWSKANSYDKVGFGKTVSRCMYLKFECELCNNIQHLRDCHANIDHIKFLSHDFWCI